jgi:hypothetical protein
VKTFSFIPSANATESMSSIINWNVNQESYESTVLWKIDLFIKWFVAFFIVCLWIIVFIALNNRKND